MRNLGSSLIAIGISGFVMMLMLVGFIAPAQDLQQMFAALLILLAMLMFELTGVALVVISISNRK